MIRKILMIAVPLLAPTLVYILYMYYTAKNRQEEEAGRRLPEWRKWPWVKLITAGSFLTALTVAVLGFPSDSHDPGAYVPPHMKDGKIVPGGFTD